MKNILVTGRPGIGKTTLVKRLADDYKHVGIRGFYTEEIRWEGKRKGFRIVSFHGKESLLAMAGESRKGPRVGRYTVFLDAFEKTALPALEPDVNARLYVIDEIGRMECFSKAFIESVDWLLKSPVMLLATIALRGKGFIEQAKRYPKTRLFTITLENRNTIYSEIKDLLAEKLE